MTCYSIMKCYSVIQYTIMKCYSVLQYTIMTCYNEMLQCYTIYNHDMLYNHEM